MIFEASGVTLNYRLEGAGVRPLICVHGVGSYLEAWDGVVRILHPDFRVLRFDLRGHGQSMRVRGRYEIGDFVRDLIALADHAGFAEFDLAGFSLGGLIAQRAALDHAKRVKRLVLISTVAGRNDDERARVTARLWALTTSDRGSHYDASMNRWFTESFQKANPELMQSLRARNAANDPECYAAAYRVLAETDLGSELELIAAPTLIMTGEEDQGSNPRMARFMHERIAGSKLAILPGLRHSILQEAPEQVAALMRGFLLDNRTERDSHGQEASGSGREGQAAGAGRRLCRPGARQCR